MAGPAHDVSAHQSSAAWSWPLAAGALASEREPVEGFSEAAYTALCLLLSAYRSLAVDDVRALHLDRLPPGPKIVTPNHAYISDAFVLPPLIPERLTFLIQSEAFSIPIVGWLLAASRQIPVDPADRSRSLVAALKALRGGRAVVIFPEGLLNLGGRVGHASSGAIRLSLRAGAPIVPVGFHVPRQCIRVIHARYAGRQTAGGWQVRGTCTVAIGDPWRPFPDPWSRPSRAAVRAAADELRERIENLRIEAMEGSERCASRS
jgi:1-acyl-sn-glycerol-3-phosphate acyltransferase